MLTLQVNAIPSDQALVHSSARTMSGLFLETQTENAHERLTQVKLMKSFC